MAEEEEEGIAIAPQPTFWLDFFFGGTRCVFSGLRGTDML